MNEFAQLAHPATAMPLAAQTIALWITGVLSAACVVYGLVLAVKHRTPLPILFLVSGFLTCAGEPLLDIIGHIYHPEQGQISVFTSYGRPVPLHVGFLLLTYYGGILVYFFEKMKASAIEAKELWVIFGSTVLISYFVELWPVSAGLWSYDPLQPLWPWKATLPINWAIANTVSAFVPLAICNAMLPRLKGVMLLIVPILSPMGAIAAHLGGMFPYYFIRNSPLGTDPIWIEASGVVSLITTMLIAQLAIASLQAGRAEERAA